MINGIIAMCAGPQRYIKWNLVDLLCPGVFMGSIDFCTVEVRIERTFALVLE